MKFGTAIFFKKLPKTEDSLPNASFYRSKGTLNGKTIWEISYEGELWTVLRDECYTMDEAYAERAKLYEAEIDLARVTLANRFLSEAGTGPHAIPQPVTSAHIAEYLGISETTLGKHRRFIQNFLPKTTPTIQ